MLVGTAVAATMLAIAGVGCSHKLDAGASSSEVNAAPQEQKDPVISQVYPGDANGEGAFVEVFNPLAKAIPGISNYAVQWAAGDRDFTSTSVMELKELGVVDDTLLPGQHVLVKIPAPQGVVGGGSGGADSLPTAAAGKVALVTTRALAQGCIADGGAECADKAKTMDYVGWGSATFVPTQPTENAPAKSLAKNQALVRVANGCQNTTNNATDFAAGEPMGRDIIAAPTPCPLPDGGTPDAGAVDAGPPKPFMIMNELKLREGASGKFGFVEISCTAEESFKGRWFAALDADGVATRAVDLSPYKCGKAPNPLFPTLGFALIVTEGGTKSQAEETSIITLKPGAGTFENATSFWLVNSATPIEQGKSYALTSAAGAKYVPWVLDANVWFDFVSIAPDAEAAKASFTGALLTVVTKTPDGLSRPYPMSKDPPYWVGGGLVDGEDALKYDPAKTLEGTPADHALTPGTKNIVLPDVDNGGTEEEEGGDTAKPTTPSKTTNNPDSAKIAESAASVCSMTSGPRSSGYGFLAAVAVAVGAVVARRKKR